MGNKNNKLNLNNDRNYKLNAYSFKDCIMNDLYELSNINNKLFGNDKNKTTKNLFLVFDKLNEYKYKGTIEYEEYLEKKKYEKEVIDRINLIFGD